MTQPSNAEIEELLEACTSETLQGAWKNRVLALKEVFDMRTHWRGTYEALLREAVAQYLRGAGVKV